MDNDKLTRLPPHAAEAEQGILGCILLDPVESMGVCVENRVGPQWFYDLRHQTIFDTLADMFDQGVSIDVITLQQRLKDAGMLENIGGIAYLSVLPDVVPSAANLSYYIDIVREKFFIRSMIRVCADSISVLYDSDDEPRVMLDKIEQDVLAVASQRTQEKSTDIKELVRGSITRIEAAYERKGQLTGIGTGFPDLDRITSGFKPGEYIVIAARPSVGKTSLAMNIAEHVAVNLRLPTGVFSLEMTSESLVDRMICSRARVNIRNVAEGFLTARDFPKITSAAAAISGAPIHIRDKSGISIIELRSMARRMVQQYGIKLFVIDYLQLLTAVGSKRKHEGRQQEITEISAGIKGMAKDLGVPVIVLSQLNRLLDREQNRKPRMSDLRESGSIEQDADTIGMLYRPDEGDDTADYSDSIPVNMLIVKQRNGPAQLDILFTFQKSFTRFESRSKVDDKDVPEGVRGNLVVGSPDCKCLQASPFVSGSDRYLRMYLRM